MNRPDDQTPPTPRPAATVILHRPTTDGGVAVYLLRRSPKSRFMADQFVFPGGTLDPADGDAAQWRPLVDLIPADIDRRFGWPAAAGSPVPLAFLVAGIRETLEEAGILLATERKGGPAALTEAQVAAFQADQGRAAGGFAAWIESRGWRLCLAGLRRWSHWITPLRMRSRFDTRFFMAALPDGQTCRPDPRETPEGIWVTPRQALADNAEGRLSLSPPTLVTLSEMLRWPDTAALESALSRRPWGKPIMPRLAPRRDGSMIIEPWDPHYDDPDPTPGPVLPVGESFSRLWQSEGRWLPVAVEGS